MKSKTVHPVLRTCDVERTLHFSVGYVGCKLDWQEGDGSGPTCAQVSLGPLQVHLSTHHGDGTPGTVLLIEIAAIKTFLDELHGKDYPFTDPGLDAGPATCFGSSSAGPPSDPESAAPTAARTTCRPQLVDGADEL